MNKEEFQKIVEKCNGNYAQVARALNIGESTARRWRDKYGIAVSLKDDINIEIQEDIEKEKYKQETDKYKKLYNILKKKHANTELIIEKTIPHIKALNKIKIKPLKLKDNKRKKATLLLLISDSQIAEITKCYTTDVFKQFLYTLANKTIRAYKILLKEYNIDNFIGAYLGDIVNGESIYAGQKVEIDLYGQIYEVGVRAFLEFESTLLKNIPIQQTRICIPGNHGDNSRNEMQASDRSNWDLVLYKQIQAYLIKEDIKWLICDKPYDDEFNIRENIKNNIVMFTHGKDVPKQADAMKKKADAWNTVFKKEGGIDILCCAHRHTIFGAEPNLIYICRNGCFPIGDNYPIRHMGCTAYPKQSLLLITENGVEGRFDLRLDVD